MQLRVLQAASARAAGHEGSTADFAQYASETLQLPGGMSLVKGRLLGSAASELLNDVALADSDLVPRRYEGESAWDCNMIDTDTACTTMDY